ncbi:MAG: dihydrofolate reductase family protein [Chitinophaga sp.]|uniref:dihydrofolate reductase family protein n=1 Tax=Chitinophaga sp. TaxID=1869181 RepID=UPI0025C0EC74|nr:dihydrofolate reductase family protein [Chitinophaga sp.]MBV8252397.1 dihydrofolate reductase family protein [Chitinophaga sp.]
MNKLILETQISIDGFIADKNGSTDWMIWNWGPEWTWDEDLQKYHTDLNKSASTIIISSQMAKEGFNAHWQAAASDPNDKRYQFAHHIHHASKYVASTTLTKEVEIPGGWDKTNILNGDLKESITALKKSASGNMIVYGGATLLANLINEDLIDEYHLIVNPVAIGSGLSIFKKRKQLKLIKSTPFACGVVVNQYA